MDSPFLPALICFGPFFLMLLCFSLMRRGQEPAKIQPVQVAAALIVSIGIGVAGVAVSFLLI